jgi:hypothetical protein
MSFSRLGLAVIGLLVILPVTVFAQRQEAKPDETRISISYSRCLSPSEPRRFAMSEEDQRGIPECNKWSTPERIDTGLNPDDYRGKNKPVSDFLKDVIRKIYKTQSSTYYTHEIYKRFQSLGWQQVEASKEKTGSHST